MTQTETTAEKPLAVGDRVTKVGMLVMRQDVRATIANLFEVGDPVSPEELVRVAYVEWDDSFWSLEAVSNLRLLEPHEETTA